MPAMVLRGPPVSHGGTGVREEVLCSLERSLVEHADIWRELAAYDNADRTDGTSTDGTVVSNGHKL